MRRRRWGVPVSVICREHLNINDAESKKYITNICPNKFCCSFLWWQKKAKEQGCRHKLNQHPCAESSHAWKVHGRVQIYSLTSFKEREAMGGISGTRSSTGIFSSARPHDIPANWVLPMNSESGLWGPLPQSRTQSFIPLTSWRFSMENTQQLYSFTS